MKILPTVASLVATAGLLLCGALRAEVPLVRFPDRAVRGIPTGGPYVPPGSLFDNEQSNASLATLSQNSDGSGTARSGDDFFLAGAGCASGSFELARIRAQIAQAVGAEQPFGLDLYMDRGDDTAPVPGINPFATLSESGRVALGPFGAGFTLFEVEFDAAGIVLAADTRFWLSAFGADGAVNSSSGNNFYAASAGAAGTTPNGVFIAPAFGYSDWVSIAVVAQGVPRAFSFAIDGSCATAGFEMEVPATSGAGGALLACLLALAALFALRR